MSNVSILEELEDDETPFVQPDDELCVQISQQVKPFHRISKKKMIVILCDGKTVSAFYSLLETT